MRGRLPAHLDGELMDHARKSALVRFAGAVDVAVAQADDRVGQFALISFGESFHADLLKAYVLSGSELLRFLHRHGTAAIDAATARPDHARFGFHRPVEQAAECFDVVAQHAMRIAGRRPVGGDHAGDARLVEDAIEPAQVDHRLHVVMILQGQHVAVEVDQILPPRRQESCRRRSRHDRHGQPPGQIRPNEPRTASHQNAQRNLQCRRRFYEFVIRRMETNSIATGLNIRHTTTTNHRPLMYDTTRQAAAVK